MGKSDAIIFPWYAERMRHIVGMRIAFLGQTGPNLLTRFLQPAEAHFYDFALGNWDINQESVWDIADVDAIVCTRSAYFSNSPDQFIERCLTSVPRGSSVLIDWGLGDHWRHPQYMVGWKKGDEQVFAQYDSPHPLMSTFWISEFAEHPTAVRFSQMITRFGYDDDLEKIVRDEVPSVATTPLPSSWDMIALWEESPQLYILTEFQK